MFEGGTHYVYDNATAEVAISWCKCLLQINMPLNAQLLMARDRSDAIKRCSPRSSARANGGVMHVPAGESLVWG